MGGAGESTGRHGLRNASWAVLVICCTAQFMVVLDVSIVNVALPAMRRDLGLSVSGQQWVINAYTLTFAGLLMLAGRAADLFGRRVVFVTGLSIFTSCSLAGGLAQSGGWLIAARAAQGVGAAILAPATLSLITTTFRQPDERRRAFGAWSATASSGGAIGGVAGGLLTEYLGWRWVLIVNVPIGIALLVLAVLVLSESRSPGATPQLDVAGALSITAGLTAVVYAVVNTDTRPWGSPETIVPLAIGVALLATFLVIEARVARAPLVPLAVFKLRSLRTANLVAMTVGAGLFAVFFFTSLYLQEVNGYSPLRAGMAFLPAGIGSFIGSLTGVRLVVRLGARRLLVLGPVVAAGAMAWMSQAGVGSAYWTAIFGPILLVGLGLGWCFLPMTQAATAGLPHSQAGLSSGLINTTRQIGGAVGLAAMATVAASTTRAAARSGRLVALSAGYDRAFTICAVIIAVAAVLALMLPGRPTPAPELGDGAPAAAAAPSTRPSKKSLPELRRR